MHMKERLYLTEDREKAVYSSDRRGRHLLCKQGAHLDDAEARKYGIVNGRLSALMPADDPRAKKQIAKNKKAEPAVKDAIIEDVKAKEARIKQEEKDRAALKKDRKVTIGYGGN